MLEKITRTIAGIISILTSPLLMPTWAMTISLWGTYLAFAPAGAKWEVLLFTFALTSMVPVIVIFVLHKTGVVTHPSLNERTDRPFIYATAVMSYLALAFYLSRVNSPRWLSMFVLASACAALFTMIVNFKWKISGHATAAGGVTALTFFICFRNLTLHNNDWLFVGAILTAGAVMTSRLILERHTLGQVIAGFFSGVFWVSFFELVL